MIRRLARPMLAAIFVSGGLEALRHPGARVQQAAPFTAKVAELTGTPDDPEMMVRANGALMATAGLMLATGRFPRLASTMLAASIIPTTLVGHQFWKETDQGARANQQTQFLKNLGLLGGTILASVDTAGKPGLAWRAQNAAKAAKREARLAKAQAKLAVS
ncbi:DoxX family protein [Mobilicoccus massiliensis]|uniref:DoxX family protein n=1 Tax=Mobilicoccus massiliensis TaxID=1522310 RepID=UPI00058D94F9|nr:DoxX family protein [Mobilicoccus massiliensis]